jgi:glycosyltransferase involved in cell wall biosynthesis
VRDGIEGFIIPARDVAAIRNRIQTLYEDRERARAMGAAARLRAEQYTWAHYRLRVAEAYERIAKASGFQ